MKLSAPEKKFKKEIIDLLKRKKLYESPDDFLIEELLYQNRLLEEAKEDISLRGINVNVRKNGEPYYNTNQSLAVVNQCTKTIQSLYRQLCITPTDRAKIKVLEKEISIDLEKFLKGEN